MNCPLCSLPLDSDDHIFNTGCGLSNSEYQQLQDAICQLPNLSDDLETQLLLSSGAEAMLDQLAFERFKRELRD